MLLAVSCDGAGAVDEITSRAPLVCRQVAQECGPAACCHGAVCLLPKHGEAVCVRACRVDTDCPADNHCVTWPDGLRACAPRGQGPIP